MLRKFTPALVLAVLALPSVAVAGTITVPGDHETINGAIDAASNGDTIVVSAGSYPENVQIRGYRDLTIKAKGEVVINPVQGNGIFIDEECKNITLSGLTVRGNSNIGIFVEIADGTLITKWSRFPIMMAKSAMTALPTVIATSSVCRRK